MTRFIVTFLLIVLAQYSWAQEQLASPNMADFFRESGKIYVVIAVMATVFIGILGYLILIERKLKKLEDKLDKH